MNRCHWVDLNNPLYVEYHDEEWGVPVHDDVKLFEMLILEGAQAGLSWSTVLKKRENYRNAFDAFDVRKVAAYTDAKITSLLADEGIIRNKLKIASAVRNAKIFLAIAQEFGSFSEYLWSFVDGKQITNAVKTFKELPAKTELSDRISTDLKKRGMNFVGSTIIYAFLEAVGVVNDHEVGCFRYREVGDQGK